MIRDDPVVDDEAVMGDGATAGDDPQPQGLDALLLGVEALDEEPMILVYKDPQGQKSSFDLAGHARTTIGRDVTCSVAFRDSHVSRVHATIELVQGQHLLRDNGSSNGTFLNGLRLNSHHAFALRGRDVIEVGSMRIHYVRAGSSGDTPAAGEPADLGAASHELLDLAKDGHEALDAEARSRLRAAILGAFMGVAIARGMQRVLPLVLERLSVHTVAIFVEDARHGVRAAASLPAFDAAAALVAIALRCWRDRRGHIVRGLAPLDTNELPQTCVQSQTTSAAVPITDGTRARGVLCVQRQGGARLSRKDLALLAVLAEGIAATMALKETADSGDTRT